MWAGLTIIALVAAEPYCLLVVDPKDPDMMPRAMSKVRRVTQKQSMLPILQSHAGNCGDLVAVAETSEGFEVSCFTMPKLYESEAYLADCGSDSKDCYHICGAPCPGGRETSHLIANCGRAEGFINRVDGQRKRYAAYSVYPSNFLNKLPRKIRRKIRHVKST
ncbi:MAG: uncharacterized protein KVP18_005021 [Porospora cf. gigantea A]|uniref:uncharacterized protein n=1 Tax=Porospora cf. gigantea A TaxID=2853593 RepID=UPI00355951FE|nr:MAG: hypothetical protein KVP18_005021 [Porospora cf. gigantea A]